MPPTHGTQADETAREETTAEDVTSEGTKETEETKARANAREAAENHLDAMPFSRSGLIDQLTYDGFTTAQATYGADAVDL